MINKDGFDIPDSYNLMKLCKINLPSKMFRSFPVNSQLITKESKVL